MILALARPKAARLRAGPARLRPLRQSDASALHPAFADAATMRYWAGPPHETLAETEGDIAWWLDHHPNSAWTIMDADDRIVGRIGLQAVRAGVGEVGVILAPCGQGRGIASAALAAVVRHGFGPLGLHRIQADVDPDNHASIRLFERAGFAREGLLRHAWRTHIGLRDSVIFALLAAER